MSRTLRGFAITGLGVLILSPDSLLVRLIRADGSTLLFWRGLLMCIGLIGLMTVRRSLGSIAHAGWTAVLAGLLLSGSTTCFVHSLLGTSVADTLILISAAPLWAALLSWLVLREPIATRTWAAIVVALAGIGLTVSGSIGRATLSGDAWGLGTSLFLASYFCLLRSARSRDMTPAVMWAGLAIAGLAWPAAHPLSVAGWDILWLGILGLVVLPLSFALISAGPRYISAPQASLVMLIETVLGPFWVWLALGEFPGWRAVAGGAVVVTTLAVHALAEDRSRQEIARPGTDEDSLDRIVQKKAPHHTPGAAAAGRAGAVDTGPGPEASADRGTPVPGG